MDTGDIRARAQAAANEAGNLAKSRIEGAKEDASEVLKSGFKTVKEAGAQIRGRAETALTGADGYVRESPWLAVGVAAAVGVLVGVLLNRR